jgi:hypothetical protein
VFPTVYVSVADQDPYVLGHPGSGFFCHQDLNPSLFWEFFMIFYFKKNDGNVPSKSNKQENLEKIEFLLPSSRSLTKIAGSGSVSQMHESADPDLYQNVKDPQHWLRPTFAKNYLYVRHQLTILIQFLWKKVYVEEIFYL